MYSDEELEKLVSAWLLAAEAEPFSEVHRENFWALDEVMGLEEKPEKLWQFVMATYRRPMSAKAQSYFAAAPLEYVFGKPGPQYIDQVEDLAKKDPLFKDLLGGVWRSQYTTDEVWQRLEATREYARGP